MRTTVTLDADVEKLLKKTMRQRGTSFKKVLNEAVRRGVQVGKAKKSRRFVQRTFRMGLNPGYDLTKALALSSAMEDEELLRKLHVGK